MSAREKLEKRLDVMIGSLPFRDEKRNHMTRIRINYDRYGTITQSQLWSVKKYWEMYLDNVEKNGGQIPKGACG